MTCSVKFVRLNEIYMCTEFYMNTCKHVWAIHQVFKLCSRGRRRAPVPRPGPSLCGVRTPTDSNVCANFQEFLSMLRPPKVPGWLNKKKKKKKKKNNNPLEINRALRLTGLGPNNEEGQNVWKWVEFNNLQTEPHIDHHISGIEPYRWWYKRKHVLRTQI